MAEKLSVTEIFLSLQGESSYSGLPCVFIRLAYCNLRCSYCDTAYAFGEGKPLLLAEVCERVIELARPFAGSQACMRLPLVEITGGEPLLQESSLPLMKTLCDDGFIVLLETSGAMDISPVDARVRRIVDLKCPSSGEVEHNRWENINCLNDADQVKFVIGTHEDYAWAKRIIDQYKLASICPLLVSHVTELLPSQQDASLKRPPPGHTPISRQELAQRIIADAMPVRFQLQLHKFIWPPDARGV